MACPAAIGGPVGRLCGQPFKTSTRPVTAACNRVILFLTVKKAFVIQMQTKDDLRMLSAFFYFHFFGFRGDFLFRKSAHAKAS